MHIIAQSNRMTTIEFPSSATTSFTTTSFTTASTTISSSFTAEVLPAPTPTKVERGWHTDPFDQHDLRFHDGSDWTDHVTHFGPVPCRGCNPYAR